MAGKNFPRTIVGVGKKGWGSFSRTVGNLSSHDLGEVTPEALVEEARAAVSLLRCGMQLMMEGCLSEAMDYYFKSAAVAVNIIFTARVHGISVPDGFIEKMALVSSCATKGITKVAKMVALKKILKHEEIHHLGFMNAENLDRIFS